MVDNKIVSQNSCKELPHTYQSDFFHKQEIHQLYMFW